MKPQVLIVGAGFCGLTVATRLDRYLQHHVGEFEVKLIERKDEMSIGAYNQFVFAGKKTTGDAVRKLSGETVNTRHVEFVKDEIAAFDFSDKLRPSAVSSSGHKYASDIMVIASGMEVETESIPGLKDNAANMCDLGEMVAFKEKFDALTAGTVLVTICTPAATYKCPPVPYELALKMDELLTARKVRENVKVVLTTKDPTAVPQANPQFFTDELKNCGIDFRTSIAPTAVDGAARTVTFDDEKKTTVAYDLLLAMYPWQTPKAVRSTPALVNPKGFVPVNPKNHRALRVARVYAGGDCSAITINYAKAGERPSPKAGAFAENHGLVIADNILDDVQRLIAAGSLEDDAAAWAGAETKHSMWEKSACTLEAGQGREVLLSATLYQNPDKPEFVFSPATPGDKLAWIANHEKLWFK